MKQGESIAYRFYFPEAQKTDTLMQYQQEGRELLEVLKIKMISIYSLMNYYYYYYVIVTIILLFLILLISHLFLLFFAYSLTHLLSY